MIEQVLEFLRSRESASGAGHVTTFEVWLAGRGVTVNVISEGERIEAADKFVAEAFWTDLPVEERHGGSPGYSRGTRRTSVEAALMEIHWHELREES